MATRNKAFHLNNVGRGGDHEVLVIVPEPLFKRDRVLANVQFLGSGGRVQFSIEAWELEKVSDFLSEVVAALRAMERDRAEEAQ